MSFLTGAAYLALPRENGNWLIKDLLPVGGLAVCYGKPKIGKSFFALGIAEAISNGHPHYLGLPILQHGPVAYLQIDTPRSVWHERMVKAVDEGGHNFDKIYVADKETGTPYPFNILMEGSWLKTSLKAVEATAGRPPVLVVVDTLREIFAGDENDSSVMRNVIAAIVEACGPNVAILFLSHRKKELFGQGDDLMSDLRGSSYVAGRMDCIIALTGKLITFQSRAAALDTIAVFQDSETGMWHMDPEEARLLDTMRLVIEQNPSASVNKMAEILSAKMGEWKGKKMEKEGARSQLRRKLDMVKPRLVTR